ncbi:hypothetical protein B0H34DRAFT_498915 [Crassisporium funariophilum]|nr:hypothetical protein B0H34DRAFT_498915 [Crassisporium funariophilum]
MELQSVDTTPSGDLSVHSALPKRSSISNSKIDLTSVSKEGGDRVSIALGNDTANVTLSRKQITRGRIQFLALCWTLFLSGWNDGTLGPLLPRIQRVYHVGFAIVSLIFVFACIGFVSGALINMQLTNRVGFGKAQFVK